MNVDLISYHNPYIDGLKFFFFFLQIGPYHPVCLIFRNILYFLLGNEVCSGLTMFISLADFLLREFSLTLLLSLFSSTFLFLSLDLQKPKQLLTQVRCIGDDILIYGRSPVTYRYNKQYTFIPLCCYLFNKKRLLIYVHQKISRYIL